VNPDRPTLEALLEVSRAVGGNADYVQGGGGNTSAKTADGRSMLIKASGTTLAQMTEAAGWVEMDVPRTLALLDASLEKLDAQPRERAVLEGLCAAVSGGPPGRPSVESALHAQLGRVVIHTHPAAVNALTCGPGQAALRELARPGEARPLWVGFAPGYLLAQSVRREMAAYRQRHGAAAQVIFLENHGLFVATDDACGCLRLHDDWVGRCETYFAPVAAHLETPPEADPGAVRAALAAMRRGIAARTGKPAFLRWSEDPELRSAACSPSAGTLAAGALTPDQIVYCGARSVVAESLAAAPAPVAAAMGEAGAPRVILVRGAGAIVASDQPGKLAVVEDVAACCARSIRLAAGRGGARNLSAADSDFIVHWEAEHYRAKLLEQSGQELAGSVAVVSGAASGLGCGIAQGLVGAGAAVAFCDIDLQAADQAAAQTGRLANCLAVHMDVTDEGSVARAFDRVVRHWGGADIAVCAAGIAPAYELAEMPLDKWRAALEINLTGYFLVGREAARVMKAQGQGGSIVLVSSKSGLEASKANSAYNATKAGELHLARGWALELGREGIRVNAVAPGNVFEGSKIWNAEYIKACARKRNIRPEEVIPYYNSLTALGREIKRSDVAGAVVFLCSDQAHCITGQTLVVDSGQVMVR
jgi:NAD(P)-dependent dehydrogenase (short-subunit alcohol dehydrogenase family)/rhamnose utilization protein RhaD (predicted bifunctional aldolase and dehydrogenase)